MAAKKKLLSLVEAIDFLNEVHQVDPTKAGRNVISIGTLYNAINKKRLTRHGPFHFAQVDADELLREFGPKRGA